jgi:Kelch motif
MPFTSEAPTCALMEDTGIVYCAEGDTGSGFASYNIATDSWTSLAAIPGGDHYGSSSGAFNGKVFVAGGTTSFSNAVQVYDVGLGTWSAGTAAPDSFLLAGYHQIGQFLYVVGGWTGFAPNGLTTTNRLDMSSAPGVWESGPAFTMGRADFGLAHDPGTNKLYALAGDLCCDSNFFNSTDEVDEVDLSAWPGGTWVMSPPNLPQPNRQANQAGFFGNGDIWSVGGINGATFQFLPDVYHRNNGGGCVSPTPTATATATFTPTATATVTVSATPTATATATTPPPSATPTATETPRVTPTPRPPPTPRPRPTSSPHVGFCYFDNSDCSGIPNVVVSCVDCLTAHPGGSWSDGAGCNTTCPEQ